MLFWIPDACSLHKTSCKNKETPTNVNELSSLEINAFSGLNRDEILFLEVIMSL